MERGRLQSTACNRKLSPTQPSQTCVASARSHGGQARCLHAQAAGNLSILFDVGGIAGGVLAGALSDKSGAAACVSAAFVFGSLPAMWLYRAYGHLSLGWNVLLMAAAGCFVNGPYALITTAVSADLGSHSSVAGVIYHLVFASCYGHWGAKGS